MYVDRIVTRKLRKNGGAVKPCARTAVKPTVRENVSMAQVRNYYRNDLLSLRMVGRKTGREAKLTLTEKYISYQPLACGDRQRRVC